MVTSQLVLLEAVTETLQASREEHPHGFAVPSSHLAAGDLGWMHVPRGSRDSSRPFASESLLPAQRD